MFLVRKNQLEVFGKNSKDKFIIKMNGFIRDNFPGTTMENSMLNEWVKIAMEEAVSFGIEMETDIENYLYLKWRYKELQQNPLEPEALDILTYPNRSAAAKIDLLISYYGPKYK